ncbi:phosphotransferase [Chelativorans sp. M5D2P16]|uniref:phosphotransferase n=1 Tax=Chelativorans sp. M5D2P16 TaxID=3095678 RepID=UPI002ACB0094|nr:phosphotransferase [Chelativorans sp. M5D2P16]MDZ5698400.1 phosphotransferase [Chelativorans sp. M5D2P16]
MDEQDREILSFLPGEVPSDLGHFGDAQITTAADLPKRFHDATADFPLVRDSGAEVICHNDWGPTNAVFRDGLPYGLIDFHTMVPGLRLWDLGYSAFAWLDLGNPDYTGDEQIRRLSAMAEAYGKRGCSADQIAIYAVARQTALAISGRVQANAEMANWAASAASWTVLNVTERLSPTGYALRSRI